MKRLLILWLLLPLAASALRALRLILLYLAGGRSEPEDESPAEDE